MNSTQPVVSIVIVNFNGKNWLSACLPTIYTQSYEHIEVIVVDNNSQDGSVEYVKENFPEIQVLCNSSNVGFAEGNNQGVAIAKGDFFFLLNSDTQLNDLYLVEKSIHFLQMHPKIGVLQPKICLLMNPNKIDLCGSFWTPTTMLYHYGCFQDENDPLFNQSFPVFTCKGAALFIRRECVEQVGLFDADFWCYYEETDFCHRVWLSGYECWYFSEVKMLHFNGGTSLNFDNSFIQYHNCKNKLRSFIKNFSGFERISVITRFTLSTVVLAGIFLFTGRWKSILSIFQAYSWNIKKLQEKQSRSNRLHGSIPDLVIRSPKPVYYIDLIKDLKTHDYRYDF